MGFFTWLLGLKNAGNKPAAPAGSKSISLQEITSRLDLGDGWNDIFLKMSASTSTGKTRIYTCKGLHKGEPVGIEIEIRADIDAGITPSGELHPQSGFVKDAVQLRSIGTESDGLIKALSVLYGFPSDRPFIKKTAWLTAFSLNQKPVDLNQSGDYKLKVFFDQSEGLYWELFLNINTVRNEIELSEKDQDYRENIIKTLTQ